MSREKTGSALAVLNVSYFKRFLFYWSIKFRTMLCYIFILWTHWSPDKELKTLYTYNNPCNLGRFHVYGSTMCKNVSSSAASIFSFVNNLHKIKQTFIRILFFHSLLTLFKLISLFVWTTLQLMDNKKQNVNKNL